MKAFLFFKACYIYEGHGQRGGEGETYGESNMEASITIGKEIASGILLHGSGNSNRGCVSPRGAGRGGRWEGGSRGRGYRYTSG